jgi:branched-chain amino acid transport system substrate-binding protein
LTGPSAPDYVATQAGLKARLGVFNAASKDGTKIVFVTVDDASTPQGDLAGAKQLIQQDKVFAVIGLSPYLAGSLSYIESTKVPFLTTGDTSASYDNPANTSLFASYGSAGSKYPVATTYGKFMQSQGVTVGGAVAYGTSSASVGAATAAIESMKAAGVSAPYLNTALDFTTADVSPQVQGMKSAGVNGIYAPLISTTSFAILTGLQQAGQHVKVALLPEGYGGDLLKNSAAVSAAQGVFFQTYGAPVELQTPATKAFQAALQQYSGVTGDPSKGDYDAWITADLFVRGLQAAGDSATQADFITKLRAVTNWNAGGLLPRPVDMTKFGNEAIGTVSNCFYTVQLKGHAFVPVQGASPVCGDLTGKNALP